MSYIIQKGACWGPPFKISWFGNTRVISYDTGISACPGVFGFCGFTLTFAGFSVFSRVMFLPWMSNNFPSQGLQYGCRRQDKSAWIGEGVWVAKRLETSKEIHFRGLKMIFSSIIFNFYGIPVPIFQTMKPYFKR